MMISPKISGPSIVGVGVPSVWTKERTFVGLSIWRYFMLSSCILRLPTIATETSAGLVRPCFTNSSTIHDLISLRFTR